MVSATDSFALQQPVLEAIIKLQEGNQVGLQTSNFEFAFLNANLWPNLLFDRRTPLPTFDMEYTKHDISHGISWPDNCAVPQHALCPDNSSFDCPLSSKGNLFDYDKAYQ
jgi:hypothetical protein